MRHVHLCAKRDSMWLEHILPHFHGNACDYMCGALVLFSKKLMEEDSSVIHGSKAII